MLADAGRSAVSRAAAGLQLKNNLTSKNPDTKLQYVVRWLQIDPVVRNRIKELALATLGTETSQPSSAAQVCVYVCVCVHVCTQQCAKWTDTVRTRERTLADIVINCSLSNFSVSTLMPYLEIFLIICMWPDKVACCLCVNIL